MNIITQTKITNINNAVESVTGIQFESLISRSRRREIMQSLTLFVALLRLNTDITQIDLGNLIKRDHATIIHHEKKYANYLETDPNFRQLAETIINRLPWL